MKIKYKHFPSHLLLLCKYLHIYLTKWKLSPLVHTLVVASSSPQTDWQLNTTQFSLSNVSNTDDHVYDDDDNHIRTTYPENSWSISYETTNCRRNYKTVYFHFPFRCYLYRRHKYLNCSFINILKLLLCGDWTTIGTGGWH